MEFLPDVDEELDYNEELPSLSNRDASAASKSNASARTASTHRTRLVSPREEGEEEEEDDDSDDSELDSEQKQSRRNLPHKPRSTTVIATAFDREEGEASSEDDRRPSRTNTATAPSATKRRTETTATAMDEELYRNRLHERHERRERERLREPQASKPNTMDRNTREPHRDMEVSRPSATTDASGEIRSELKHSQMQRGDSGDKVVFRSGSEIGLVRMDETSDSSRKSSGRMRTDEKLDRRSGSTEALHIPRSHSTSYLKHEPVASSELPYRLSSTATAVTEGVPNERVGTKKSKRSRHHREDTTEEMGSGSKLKKSTTKKHKNVPTTSIELTEWARTDAVSFKQTQKDNMPINNPSEKRSPSSSGSSPESNRVRDGSALQRPSTIMADIEDPQLRDQSRRKGKHRYHRDTREAAPPPEDGEKPSPQPPSVGLSTKRHKSSKHRTDDPSRSSKHKRPSRERGDRSKSRLDHGDNDEDNFNRRDRKRRSRSNTRRKPSNNTEVPESKTTDLARVPSREKRRQPSSHDRSPFREVEQSPTNDATPDEKSSTHQDPRQSKTTTTSPTTSPPTLAKRESLRLQPRYDQYRLISTSESDDAVDDQGELIDNNDNFPDDSDGDAQQDDEDDVDGETAVDRYSAHTGLSDLARHMRDGSIMARSPPGPRVPSKPFYFPSIQGCRSVEEFECLNRIEEGTYGVVYRARDKKIDEIVALKRLKMEKERDGFPITSLREINTLMKAQHENIVTVREVVVGSNMDKIFLVMDYVEHDMKSLMEIMNGPFSVGEVKCLLVQLLRAVRHLHDNWILHRDLKTSNLLLSHRGILKVGDFGLAREYGSPLKHYTEVVVTLWYRAPELLLGTKQYTCPIDMWSVGCIFAEFLLQRPLFPGKGEVDELNIIFRDLGTPTERIWPGVTQLPGMKKLVFTEYPYNQLRRRFTEKQISDQGFDLLNSFLTYCPDKRITAEKGLNHAYFNERPRAIHPSMFPSWPAKSEGGIAVRRAASPRPPAGGGALAAAAASIAQASNTTNSGARVRYQPPAPPMGGQRFYSTMSGGVDSRPGTAVGSGDMSGGGGGLDKGFLLRF